MLPDATAPTSTGSGFFLRDADSIYLVTAKHVLFDERTNEILAKTLTLVSYSKELADTTPNIINVDLSLLTPDNVKAHPSQDIAAVRLFHIDSDHSELGTPLEGLSMQSTARAGIVVVGPETVKRLKDVLIGNEVLIMGYPTSLALRPNSQIDPRRPLLRHGIIAGENPQTHAVILDCPVYFGNSGGPVIEIDRGFPMNSFKLIGVVSQYVPYADGGKTFAIVANSGYSIATPIDYLYELIEGR
jgi:S1-C subfamily serine protease